MLRLILATAAGLVAASAAFAQSEASGTTTVGSGTKTMGQLLTEGYEIKASVPNGTKFIVFMQKDKTGYACEFVSVAKTRCGSIN